VDCRSESGVESIYKFRDNQHELLVPEVGIVRHKQCRDDLVAFAVYEGSENGIALCGANEIEDDVTARAGCAQSPSLVAAKEWVESDRDALESSVQWDNLVQGLGASGVNANASPQYPQLKVVQVGGLAEPWGRKALVNDVSGKVSEQ